MSLNPDSIFQKCCGREFTCFYVIFFALWLGFPNSFIDVPLIILLWPVGCAFLGKFAKNAKKALLSGWLATFFGAAACLYWLYLPVHEVGNLHVVPALACALLISFVVASQSGFFSLAAFFTRTSHPAKAAVCLGLAWYLLEYLYAFFAGFPWLVPAAALAEWPVFLQVSDIIGAYACDGLWVCALLLCAFSLPLCGQKFMPAIFFSGLSICILVSAYGVWRLDLPDKELATSVNALFVEGNIDQNRKWDPAFQEQTLNHYISLSEAGLADARAKGIENPLVIWPETALPFFYQSKVSLAAILREFVKRERAPLLFGAPGIEYLQGEPEAAVFNRAFLLAPDGRFLGYYDKEQLVPFGEYLPSWLQWGFLQSLLQGVGSYHSGSGGDPLRYGRLALGMLICYEVIFPWLAEARVARGANILVDISNDGWFGASPAVKQHLLLAVPRSIEQNRWLLRATNTGISAVVDPRGRIVARGSLFKTGSILAQAGLEERRTLYFFLAPWLPFAAFVLLAILTCTLPVSLYRKAIFFRNGKGLGDKLKI